MVQTDVWQLHCFCSVASMWPSAGNMHSFDVAFVAKSNEGEQQQHQSSQWQSGASSSGLQLAVAFY